MPKISQVLKSKTLWMGAATVGGAAWQYAAPFIPPQYMPVALAVVGAASMVLRAFTNKPLSEK